MDSSGSSSTCVFNLGSSRRTGPGRSSGPRSVCDHRVLVEARRVGTLEVGGRRRVGSLITSLPVVVLPPRFSDQSEDLAFAHAEADAVDGGQRRPPGGPGAAAHGEPFSGRRLEDDLVGRSRAQALPASPAATVTGFDLGRGGSLGAHVHGHGAPARPAALRRSSRSGGAAGMKAAPRPSHGGEVWPRAGAACRRWRHRSYHRTRLARSPRSPSYITRVRSPPRPRWRGRA